VIDTPISSIVGCVPSASPIMETRHMQSMSANVPGDRSVLAFLLKGGGFCCSASRRHAAPVRYGGEVISTHEGMQPDSWTHLRKSCTVIPTKCSTFLL
jgi:hypothetical protein